MDKEKIKKWLYDLKRLPNTRRGGASGICSSVCIGVMLLVFGILKLSGLSIPVLWLVVGGPLAQAIATAIFFAWVKFALKLKSNEG